MRQMRRRKRQCTIWLLASILTTLLLKSMLLTKGLDERVEIFSRFNGYKLYRETRIPKAVLTVEIWKDICGYEMHSLKEFPLFPNGPSIRLTTSTLRMHFQRDFENFGLRIFGFLLPTESGNYSFNLASSGSSELWLSTDSRPENSNLIANVTSAVSWKKRRKLIPLFAGRRYYMEILCKHGRHESGSHLHLKWQSSSWKEREPRDIPSEVLTAFEDNQDSNGVYGLSNPSLVRVDRDKNRFVLPMHVEHRDPSFINEKVKRRAEMHLLPFIREEDARGLFPPCQYNPSYIVKTPLSRYQSTWESHYTSIYPYDYSDIVRKKFENDNFVSFGNDQMEEKTAKNVVSQVWAALRKKHPGKYSLEHTFNVEENHDQGTGDRYLVELELKEISSGKSVRFSEYLYRPWGTHALCTPVGVAWNKSAVINILLTTGNNQGRWILHFLDNMARIYKKTNDSKFNVIITDFDRKDMDLEDTLKKSELPYYHYIRIQDTFQRALGLQIAADVVTEPNSILFTMDLHLDVPYHFLDDVRKHCVQHRIAYSPLVIRLSCGATAHHRMGHWEGLGYGLMGIYKSDWDRIGGMNVEEFKDKWGGEDWEFSDRVLMNGMEIERLKMMHFFHYFHTRNGLWTNAKSDIQSDSSHQYWV